MKSKRMARGLRARTCEEAHVVLEAINFDGRLIAECHMEPDDVQALIDDLERARTVARACRSAGGAA